MPRPPRRAGHGLGGLVRSLGPLAAPLGRRMVFWDHRGHGRSEWVPVEQCTQDQLVGGRGGRAARARARPGRRAGHQLGRVPRADVRRAPPGVDSPACRRRGGGQPRVHAPRGSQRAPAGHAGAMGGLPLALGRLAPRRPELPARLRDHPAALLPRQGPGRGRERGARRHAVPDRRAAVRHRARVPRPTTAAPSSRGSLARRSSWWAATTGSAPSTRPRRSTG